MILQQEKRPIPGSLYCIGLILKRILRVKCLIWLLVWLLDLEDVELSTDLIELREAIAENAHEVWADQRQEEGWTYGPQGWEETPDMVPYSMLPYSEKEYDRRMAFRITINWWKAGYSIIKRGDTALHNELMKIEENEGDAGI